jgi:hypothetical protein
MDTLYSRGVRSNVTVSSVSNLTLIGILAVCHGRLGTAATHSVGGASSHHFQFMVQYLQ